MRVPTVCYGRVEGCEVSRWDSYEDYLADVMRRLSEERPSRLEFELGECERSWRHVLTAFDVLLRAYERKLPLEKVRVGGEDVSGLLRPLYEQVFTNYDVERARVGVPEGHRHVRTELVIRDGRRLVFQEATVSNILRAFVTVKTRPDVRCVRLRRRRFDVPEYAEWQLIEED